jgi:dynein heavy chain
MLTGFPSTEQCVLIRWGMKSGKLYAPSAQKTYLSLIDDTNVPEINIYNTQGLMGLLRQHLNYQHWNDRVGRTIKDVNIPTAGLFTINPD